MIDSSALTCKNCNSNINGNYCANCSQRSDVKRFNLKDIFIELVQAVVETDRGIIRLTRELAVRPGVVASQYLAGRRKRYFNPFTFLLIASAAHVLVSQHTGFYTAYNQKTREFILTLQTDENSIKRTEEIIASAEKQMKYTMENEKLVNLMLLPVLALFTWLFFRKSEFNYAENLVFNIMIAAEQYIILLLLAVPLFLLFPNAILWIMSSFFLVAMGYTFFAYKQFFKERLLSILWKGILLQLLYIFIVQQVSRILVDVFS